MKFLAQKALLYFLFSLYSFTAFTQNSTIDSLKKALETQKGDTTKVNILNSLAIAVNRNNPDTSIYFANEAIELATKLDYKRGIADAYLQISMANVNLGNFEEALKKCIDAITLYDQAMDSEKTTDTVKILKGKCGAYINMGNIYAGQSNYSEALKNYFYALKISEPMGLKKSSSSAYTNIGNIYSIQDNYQQALKNYFLSIKISEKIDDKKGLSYSYKNIADIYNQQSKYSEALTYYLSSLKISEKLGDKYIMAGSYSSIGSIYTEQGNYTEGLRMVLLALKLQQQISDKMGISNSYYDVGDIYMRQKQYKAASKYFSNGLSLAKEMGSLSTIKSGYDYLSILDSAQGNYKQAYEHYKLSILYRDSLANEETNKKIVQSQMQFEFDKKQVDIKAVQDKKDIEAKRIKNQQYFIIAALGIVALAILIIALIGYRSNKHKQKANILLKKQKATVETTLSELRFTQTQLIQSEKMASLGELTAGIAHEIQNPLNFVNNFSELNKELIDEMKNELRLGNNNEAILLANDISDNEEKIKHHGKRADAIVKGMLQHSRSSSGVKEPTDINKLADEYLRLAYHGLRAKDKSFNATMKTDFDESLEKIYMIPQDMGRVILNLITNAFYVVAEKKKENIAGYEPTVSVSTKKTGDKVLISVKDNGNGIPQKIIDKIFQPFFTTKPTGQGTGLGLSLAYDIVKAHGGELYVRTSLEKVETKEGEGSTFIIELPI